ncbi:hypothetical protein TBLA_0C04170 [Henningerozyma blattae CBS 6284]|uniref:Phospholipid/glycerol acyltransferase domain-containing protein n=1 Tax=Henningerozyma blattae (strain ATCC 34711 / CBS 6284 / DSM 70876 / NBRC 10599 / NRRL Y-10934 / UCD 77-7) TaxID=1071380 RepID=I2H1G5_HENB6|nr:hypothetical protein TBLA_0C04170 [Tetrapisispora blattae CBS 6284]CCH60217.1 hypothetical protein TBLA_0C04170 [Tetrapisispora blattae CBS 6284]
MDNNQPSLIIPKIVENNKIDLPINSDLANSHDRDQNSEEIEYEDGYHYKEPHWIRKFIYDAILWVLTSIFDCFFREIKSRGSFKIPTQSPVIFVAAPHANQFVDPITLMRQIKISVNRRVSFLIAQKSLGLLTIGVLARCIMSIGVVRAQDNLKPARGKITIDPNNPCRIIGHGTKFLTEFEPKGLIGLPKSLGNVNIQSIESETSLILRKEFKDKPEINELLRKGTSYKYAPKFDQSRMYHKVFEHLAHNGCLGIFPEGGSHDRTDLLPLKAGVAIMALGCLDKHPNCNVKIVPCGMNYFHAHRFRSRAVVEFGDPIEISPELVEKYRNPETNKLAVKELLDTISEGLRAVTVTCPDYDTLMVVQATRRLYSAQLPSKLPLPMVVEMNRRIVKGYESRKTDPEIIQLKKDILNYNSNLHRYNVPDHLVDVAEINFLQNSILLFFKSFRLILALLLSLPGILMFLPVFIASKIISKRKAKTALAGSTVKIKANDVVATWKILIGMGFTPILYIIWSSLLTYYLSTWYHNKFWVFVLSYLFCGFVTYSALIIGDIGMDIFKSLRPLIFSITTPKGLKALKKQRKDLAERITIMVNSFEDDMIGDSQAFTCDEESEERKTTELKRRRLLKKRKLKKLQKKANSLEPIQSSESDAISLVNSDNSLSNIPLFSTGNNLDLTSTTSAVSTSLSEFEIEDKIQGNTFITVDNINNYSSTSHTTNGSNLGLAEKIAQAVWEKRDHDDDDDDDDDSNDDSNDDDDDDDNTDDDNDSYDNSTDEEEKH